MVVAASPTELDRQTVLLLCCHFGQFGSGQVNPLSVAEYNSVAKRLKESGLRPHHLLERRTLLDWLTSEPKINGDQLKALLERGALMGLMLERWQAIGLWAICRFEEEYPSFLKQRLREKTPPVLFGVGNRAVLHQGGLAIVGSRNADDEAIEYTKHVAETCARDGLSVISGGAKGIDRTAMLGCCEAGGVSLGVTAEPLVKAAVARHYRSEIREGRLTLITPFDPEARWLTSRAMQRNKYIYCLANAGLVISSDIEGGTWAGATEALESNWGVPIYVRMYGTLPRGNAPLEKRGAIRFPDPPWSGSLEQLMISKAESGQNISQQQERLQLMLFDQEQPTAKSYFNGESASTIPEKTHEDSKTTIDSNTNNNQQAQDENQPSRPINGFKSLDAYTTILPLLLHVLEKSRGIKDVAQTINVQQGQAKVWLQRAVEEGYVQLVRKKYKSVNRQ